MRNVSLYRLAPGRRLEEPASRFEDPQFQQLPRVIPLVHRVRDVESLVTLESNEVRPECRGGRGGERRLADAGLPFQE